MLLFLYVFYVERKARKQPKKVFIALIHSIVTHLSGKSEIYVSYYHFTKVVAQKLFLSLALSLQDFPNLHHLYAHAIFIVFFKEKLFFSPLSSPFNCIKCFLKLFFFASLENNYSKMSLFEKHYGEEEISPGLLKNLPRHWWLLLGEIIHERKVNMGVRHKIITRTVLDVRNTFFAFLCCFEVDA